MTAATIPAAPRPPSTWRPIIIALLVPLLLGSVAIWNVSEYRQLERSGEQNRQSYEKRLLIDDLLGRLEQAETAQRGYVLTGNAQFLVPYDPGRATARANLARMALRSDNTPSQQRALTRANRLMEDKFAEMDEVLRLRRTQGLAAAVGRVSDGRGRVLMEQLRVTLATLKREEAAISALRAANVRDRVFRVGRNMALVVAVTVLALLVALWALWRQRRQRYQADLAAYDAAERNRAILDSTIDPIVILNPSGSIESLNAAAVRMLGYRTYELVRRDISTLFDLPGAGDDFPARIGLSDGQITTPYYSDVAVRRCDGSVVTVDLALGAMHLPDGEHVVASMRDVSERKRAQSLKDEFVSTVSHELRTPLTSVVGALGLLRAGSGGEVPQGAARLIGIAESNARRLIRLINDMLDIDRIQSGQLPIEQVPLDLAEIVARACDDMQGLGRSRGVAVRCDAHVGPLMVSGDAERLMQVIGNLISNAIRVSPDDATVTVEVGIADGRARVTIDDDGPGVPAAFRDRIFRRFERAGEAQGTGTGLGLAISREIIQRHDGLIWFEDRPGGGTRFAFSLDLMRGADAPMPTPGDETSRILICEDDADNADLLARMVASMGHTADIVGTAAAARVALRDTRYAALLLDLHLPGESGLSLARSLRGTDGEATLPIVIVSGAAPAEREGPMPLDLIDWIAKPVDAARLDRAIRTALARSDAARPIILHLDDDRDVLDVTSALLGDSARLLKVNGLASARAVLEHESPDVAILDLHLADGTGLDLLPYLFDRNGVAIPTIIYSGYNVSADLANQVDAVLVKSRRSLPDLQATVRRILRERKRGG